MTRAEKQKAIDALKISVPVTAVLQEEFDDYIQTLNKIMDWLEQEPYKVSEYDKDHIWYRGVQYISLRRFLEVISEEKNEPCEDAINRQAVIDTIFAEGSGAKLDIDFAKILLLQRAIKALPPVTPQEPCEDEYIKVPKKALKYRTAGMVAYNAEWLKNHFDIERAVICGAQEPKTGRWIYGEDNSGTGRDGWYCNQCGHFEFWDYSSDMKSAELNLPNLCPNCKAKMQGVEE